MECVTELEILSEYKKQHRVCPKCKSTHYWQTLSKWVCDLKHPENYKDRNRVRCCSCGWKGIIHDLIPE